MAGSSRTPRIHFSDRMSDSDALMWSIESDPALRSTIVSLWILDQSPEWGRFHAKLEQVAAEVPRLRQRVVADPLGLAPPSWEDDPNFDLSFHIRRLKLSGDLRTLLDAAQAIALGPRLEHRRPRGALAAIHRVHRPFRREPHANDSTRPGGSRGAADVDPETSARMLTGSAQMTVQPRGPTPSRSTAFQR